MYDLNIDGFMQELELKQIEKWAAKVPNNGVIVELGSYKGKSSIAWAKSCDSSVKVYCLDLFPDTFYNDFLENTKDIPNIYPVKCNFPHQMNNYVDQEIDIFFLDSYHSNPTDFNAINYFLPRIKRGGILCGHDLIDGQFPDVHENIKRLEERLEQKVQVFPGTSLWCFTMI